MQIELDSLHAGEISQTWPREGPHRAWGRVLKSDVAYNSHAVQVYFIISVCRCCRRWCWVSTKRRKVFQNLSSPISPLSLKWTFTLRSLTPVWPKAWWDVFCPLLRPMVGGSIFNEAKQRHFLYFDYDTDSWVRNGYSDLPSAFCFADFLFLSFTSRVPWCIL